MRWGSSMGEIQGASTSERADRRGWRRRNAKLHESANRKCPRFQGIASQRLRACQPGVVHACGVGRVPVEVVVGAGRVGGRDRRPSGIGAVLDRRFLDWWPGTSAQQAHPHRGQRRRPARVAGSSPRTPHEGVALGPALEAVARPIDDRIGTAQARDRFVREHAARTELGTDLAAITAGWCGG